MNANDFRDLALSLPNAIEASHMDHPDFRVGRKIFATLGYPTAKCGMVKLNPAQQGEVIAANPETFEPVKGGWGERGATVVHLPRAREEVTRRALIMAWKNVAPKKLVARFETGLDES